MQNNNIILIGMPGCGKSTLGIVLAKMLCKDFTDVDLIIQKKIGMSLQEYIDKYGVDKFIELEADVVCSLDLSNSVVATGGSAVLLDRAASYLASLGKLVYLRLPYCEIERRITNLSSRGVAMHEGETLHDIYDLRTPIYERCADIIIDLTAHDIAENCGIIKRHLG